jgi:hypothetical protein
VIVPFSRYCIGVYQPKYPWLMIGVPTHGIYFGHSMPPTLQKLPKLNIHKKLQKKLYISKFYKNYIFQKINISIFITCPRNLFWAFHAPHPSKNAQIEYIYKYIIKKNIFQNFTIIYI